MARRRPPETVEPSNLGFDAREAARLREFEQVVASLQDDGAPCPDNGVTVIHGDAREDADAYQTHRDDLAQNYGIEGPIEEMLLNRVAALSWRLQRLVRVERGSIGWRAHHTRQQLQRRFEHAVDDDIGALLATHRSVAEHDNPEVIERGLEMVRRLRSTLDDGGTPDPKSALATMSQVFGSNREGRLRGRGEILGVLLYNLAKGLTDDDHPDAAEVREAAPRMRAFISGQLHEVERLLEGLHAMTKRQARELADARVEARSWLTPEEIKGFVTYERHLQAGVTDAIRELERAIARRRLRQVAAGAFAGSS